MKRQFIMNLVTPQGNYEQNVLEYEGDEANLDLWQEKCFRKVDYYRELNYEVLSYRFVKNHFTTEEITSILESGRIREIVKGYALLALIQQGQDENTMQEVIAHMDDMLCSIAFTVAEAAAHEWGFKH